MAGDAFYSSTHRPPPARSPRPLEHVCSLWKNVHRKDCGLSFHGESYESEVKLRDDGFMEFGRRVIFKEAALRLAGERRQELERDEWRNERLEATNRRFPPHSGQ